jgi:PhnB protein
LSQGDFVNTSSEKIIISVMLAVTDTPKAVAWYEKALGARVMWSLGSVAGLNINGAPFFLHEPVKQKFASPEQIGTTTARVEVFVDSPDELIAGALRAGATGGDIQNHQTPWGIHRQGGFVDPFGHHWLVGDKSPLR